jgi:hypothetical protein
VLPPERKSHEADSRLENLRGLLGEVCEQLNEGQSSSNMFPKWNNASRRVDPIDDDVTLREEDELVYCILRTFYRRPKE